MKKTIAILVLGFVMLSATNTWAQTQGQIRGLASFNFGTKSGVNDVGENKMGMGLTFGGDYFVIDKLAVGASYEFYFKSNYRIADSGSEFSLNVSSFNIDGKYYFLTEGVKLYGLAGLSFAKVKAKVDFLGTPINVSDNKTGINIGAGVDFDLSDKLFLNGQVKYNTPLEQLVFGVGVGYVIK